MNLKPRETQTKVKHEILEKYLAKWGFIISTGLEGITRKLQQHGRAIAINFVYVDCFAFTGRYAPEDGEPVFGSPIIGLEALDKLKSHVQSRAGYTPSVNCILFERERKEYNALLKTLELKGYASRIRMTEDFFKLQEDDIAVINGDYQEHLDQLLAFTGQGYTRAFYLLDPYGSSGIPLHTVSPIISQSRSDVMINFPYNDLHRKTGPAARNDPEQEKHNQYNDEMYGGRQWRQIAVKYYEAFGESRKDEMEGDLVDEYRDMLQQQDRDLAIKTIRLKFPGMERTMFYLFLTTHDPTGAITLNEILDDANQRQYELRQEHRNIRGELKQTSIFEIVADPARPASPEPDLDFVADLIYTRCQGQIIPYREVLKRMIDEPYHHSAIRKAMTKLKQRKFASYEKLANPEIVTFK